MSGSSAAAVAPASLVLGKALSWSGSVALQPALPLMDEVATAPGSLPSLAKALETVPDHRKPRGFRADQPPVLLISSLLLLIVGVLIGRRGYGSIAALWSGAGFASESIQKWWMLWDSQGLASRGPQPLRRFFGWFGT